MTPATQRELDAADEACRILERLGYKPSHMDGRGFPFWIDGRTSDSACAQIESNVRTLVNNIARNYGLNGTVTRNGFTVSLIFRERA